MPISPDSQNSERLLLAGAASRCDEPQKPKANEHNDRRFWYRASEPHGRAKESTATGSSEILVRSI